MVTVLTSNSALVLFVLPQGVQIILHASENFHTKVISSDHHHTSMLCRCCPSQVLMAGDYCFSNWFSSSWFLLQVFGYSVHVPRSTHLPIALSFTVPTVIFVINSLILFFAFFNHTVPLHTSVVSSKNSQSHPRPAFTKVLS